MSPSYLPPLSALNPTLAATPRPSPRFPAVTLRAKPSTKFARTFAKRRRDGWPPPMKTPVSGGLKALKENEPQRHREHSRRQYREENKRGSRLISELSICLLCVVFLCASVVRSLH